MDLPCSLCAIDDSAEPCDSHVAEQEKGTGEYMVKAGFCNIIQQGPVWLHVDAVHMWAQNTNADKVCTTTAYPLGRQVNREWCKTNATQRQ